MSKMEFKFWGICKGSGKLQGDATELTDFSAWAKSRGIDPKMPHGLRPVDLHTEQAYKHHMDYVPQHLANTMFKEDVSWGDFSVFEGQYSCVTRTCIRYLKELIK